MSKSTGKQSESHLIIGAGITGLMLAWHLQQAGTQVVLIDPHAPGDPEQTSYGNAGMLSFASYRPVAEPGIWKEGLKGLFDPDSALRVPWRYMPTVAPWLWRFLKESNASKAQDNAEAILALNVHSRQCWQTLIQQIHLQDLVEPTGWLKVFRTDAAYQAQKRQLPALEKAGLGWQCFEGDELQALEPALAKDLKHGLLQKDSLLLKQPHYLLQRLKAVLTEAGAEFHHTSVRSLQQTESAMAVITDNDTLTADQVSLCAGAWSQRLLATLGENVPLETERGYHLMMPPCPELGRSVMDVEQQIVASPMIEGLRMTTGEELAGLDAPADYRHINRKHKALQRLLPNADLTVKKHWLGCRPSLPDSKPIIGRHPRFPALTMAFGHGHLGMTQSAGTGALLAQIIQHQTPDINMSPYQFDRFS